MSEAEKADHVRKSILSFLPSTAIGVILGLGGYFSWGYYEDLNTTYNIAASAEFTVFVEGDWIESDFAELDDDAITASVAKGEKLLVNFPEHFYADLTRFILARLRVQQKEYDVAAAYMTDVIQYSNDAYTTSLAHYRLAQLQLLKGEPDASLKHLDQVKVDTLQPMVNDMRGDIHLRAYDYEKAWESWNAALDKAEQEQLQRYLRTKIDFVESIPTEMAETIVREGLAILAEQEKAEQEKAELEKAEKEKAELEAAEQEAAEQEAAEQSASGDATPSAEGNEGDAKAPDESGGK